MIVTAPWGTAMSVKCTTCGSWMREILRDPKPAGVTDYGFLCLFCRRERRGN